MYFEIEAATGAEDLECLAGNGVVEKQWVVVGDKECLMGFVAEYVGQHGRFIGLKNIRRVTDDDAGSGQVLRE